MLLLWLFVDFCGLSWDLLIVFERFDTRTTVEYRHAHIRQNLLFTVISVVDHQER